MFYDYHQGHDFAGKGCSIVRKNIFGVIDDRNVKLFLNRFDSRDWSGIDFRRFSKACNDSVQEYDFPVQALLGN